MARAAKHRKPMTDDKLIQAISDQLFASEEQHAYAILDGASVPDLLDQLYELEPEHVCLYRGELEPDMAEVAPYLVKLEPEAQFTDWVLEHGWRQHWGIFALSPVELGALRRHLRGFLMVYDPDNKPLYFRYYDPRVLRIYLPTCNSEELKTVFGPVECYLVEDEDPQTASRFSYTNGELQQEKLLLKQK